MKGIIGVGDQDPLIEKILDIRLIPYTRDSRLFDNRVVIEGDVESKSFMLVHSRMMAKRFYIPS